MTWQDSLGSSSSALFAADDPEDGAASSEGDMREDCPLRSRIVEVGFADLPGERPLFGGSRKQYVNLSRSEILQADSDIESANQLGRRPPIYVRVTPARETEVRVKLTRTLTRGGFPAGSANLSAREQALAHLQWARSERSYSTDENGELLIEPGLPISALGGGEFRAQAALPGEGFVNGSNSVKVKRRVYLRPVYRYAAGRNAALMAMRSIRTQMDGLGIEVKIVRSSTAADLGVREENTLPETLIDTGRRALRSTTEHLRELRPHSVAIVVGEFIEDPIAPQEFRVDIPRDAGGQLPASVNVTLSTGGSTYILVPLNDGSQFVSGTLRSSAHTEAILAARVNGLTAFSRQVSVNIADLRAAFPNPAAVRLTLRLKAIRSWAVGWAYTQHPVIYLNMRDPNTDAVLSAARAEALVVHELGHKLHLAAPGDAGQPDRQAHHYPSFNNAGVQHTGPHCSQGVPAGTDLWTTAARNAATCTMWGSLKGITANCDECKTTLRKVDLGGGF